MPIDATIPSLAHAIQLAVAPVFLLSGVGAFLGVLTTRLGRVSDRLRPLEERAGRANAAELRVLRQRVLVINRAITRCTYSALLVAGVVAAMFVGAVARIELAPAIAVAFIFAMLALIAGLTSFLREIHVATRHYREQAAAAGARDGR